MTNVKKARGKRKNRKLRIRNERRRDRAQVTNAGGDPRVEHIPGPTKKRIVWQDTLGRTIEVPVPTSFPVGPVGRFSRAVRRMNNAVERGEFLEREVKRAKDPIERERASRALLEQVARVERLQYVLTR